MTKEELSKIRENRIKHFSLWQQLIVSLKIINVSVEPRGEIGYWICYKLNWINPLTSICCVLATFLLVFVAAPIFAMISEGINVVKTIVSLTKGERYG